MVATVATVSRPKAVIIDLRGVVANKNFELFSPKKVAFYRTKMRVFVEDEELWSRSKSVVNLKSIHKMAKVEQDARRADKRLLRDEPEIFKSEDLDEMQESLRHYVLFMMDHNPRDRATGIFLEQMQVWGYDHKLLVTDVYPDVLPFFKRLKEMGIPLILTGASDKTFQQLMRRTSAGDLFDYFLKDKDNLGHTQIDFKKPANAFSKFDLLDNKSALYLTHSSISANKAHAIGIHVVVVVRDDYDPEWEKRVRESGLAVHATGSLPIIAVPDQVSHDSDPPEGHTGELDHNDTEEDLMLHPVSSKITADDVRKFPVVRSLLDIRFATKNRSPVAKTASKPK